MNYPFIPAGPAISVVLHSDVSRTTEPILWKDGQFRSNSAGHFALSLNGSTLPGGSLIDLAAPEADIIAALVESVRDAACVSDQLVSITVSVELPDSVECLTAARNALAKATAFGASVHAPISTMVQAFGIHDVPTALHDEWDSRNPDAARMVRSYFCSLVLAALDRLLSPSGWSGSEVSPLLVQALASHAFPASVWDGMRQHARAIDPHVADHPVLSVIEDDVDLDDVDVADIYLPDGSLTWFGRQMLHAEERKRRFSMGNNH